MLKFQSLCILVALCCATLVFASVPNLLTYQGYLEDGGQAANGSYNVTFLLYDQASGGTSLWEEVQTGLAVQDGLMQSYLGRITPLPSNLDEIETLYLSVVVQGDTLQSRTELASVPYAFRAKLSEHAVYADSAGNGGDSGSGFWAANGNDIHNTNSGFVGIGTENPNEPLHVEGQGIDWAARFTNSDGSSSSDVRLAYRTGAGIYMNTTGTTSGYFMNLKHEDLTKVYLTKSGYLGLGTDGPISQLHVVNPVNAGAGNIFNIDRTNDVTKQTYMGFRTHTLQDAFIGVPANTTNTLTFGYAGSAELMRYNANGLGIRTTNPQFTLDVNGNTNSSQYYLAGHQIAYTTGGGSLFRLKDPSGADRVEFQGNGGDLLLVGPVRINGDLCVTGQKNRIVETPYGTLALNAEESAEAWFSASGESQLENGRAQVELSERFLATVVVSDEHPMQVNATFYGAHGGGWYVERGLNSFTLVDPSGSNAPFTWTVKARQKGYEDVNLRVVAPTDGR
ncbi:MAG: hypothetical protein H6760_02250 [Candidatus Nomurabacteria bacterium]|nr:MAG: hypothetical protein H6760_02250 [Candidatus Nomurabacteria bacterium]